MAVPYLACMAFVASLNHLPPRVLPAIQGVEGGAPGIVHRNTDGSEDLGVMQINTRWLPALSGYFGLPSGIVRARLLAVPCFNIAAAGAVLRLYLNEAKGDLMLAIGDYHSHTVPLNRQYQGQVVRSAMLLFGDAAPGGRAASHGRVVRSQE
jgi:soluble lytic murein transglycosylase-like protein